MATLSHLHLQNVRTFSSLELQLAKVNVVIGENGSGKSTLVEATELLHRAAGSNFLEELHTIHGGPTALLRAGSPSFEIGASFLIDGVRYDYLLRIGKQGQINHERLSRGSTPDLPAAVLYQRSAAHDVLVLNSETGVMDTRRCRPQLTFISSFRNMDDPNNGLAAVADALDAIDVHVAFDVGARWVANATNRTAYARDAVKAAPTRRLQRLASNLPNAYLQLRNAGEDAWAYTMELVRLGLGDWIEAVQVEAMPSGGLLALSIKPRGRDVSLPADVLSDGMVSYLALVALVRLESERSALVFDEPELHLHPSLAARVVELLASTAEDAPVIVATHSRQVLDTLPEPASSALLLEASRDFPRTTAILRPDPAELRQWLENYEGLGSVIAAGFGAAVFDAAPLATAARDADVEDGG